MVSSVQNHGEETENCDIIPLPERHRLGESYETGSHRSGANSGEQLTNMRSEGGTGSGQVAVIGEEKNGDVAMASVREEEVEAKISAWEKAKVAKINNRFKREDAVISGWENEQVLNSTSWITKIERRLEEKRAKALERMQNQIAKAHGKAEERRASAEARRGTKVAEIAEVANHMRAAGRPPSKSSFK